MERAGLLRTGQGVWKKPVQQSPLRCVVCKIGPDKISLGVILKCKVCLYQIHARCCYSQSPVPPNLLNPTSIAVLNWRCYNCKCCQLCSKNDENDNLLLCDGCDAGEHMGCQKPPLGEVPPAPWYCSICVNIVSPGARRSTVVVNQTTVPNERTASPALGSTPRPITVRDSVSVEGAPTEDRNCQSVSADSCCTLGTSAQSAWTAVLNTETPPMTDDHHGQDADCSIIPVEEKNSTKAPMPIKIRLEKRPNDLTWQKCDVDSSNDEPETRRKRRKTVASPGPCDSGDVQLTATAHPVEILPDEKTQEPEKNGTEVSSLHERPPSVTDSGSMEASNARSWSVDRVGAFFKTMGHGNVGDAFKREEIDGTALLLLQRHDVICNFGLKLGPALKAFKLIEHIKEAVRYRYTTT